MAARKSRKKKQTADVPVTDEAESNPTSEEIEVTQSDSPEAAVADDTSTAPAEPAENNEEQSSQTPAAKKRGITVSRPMPNAQAEVDSEEVPARDPEAGPDKFRPIDIKHPAWVSGEPRIVTVMRNLRTGEIVYPARLQALVEAAEEN